MSISLRPQPRRKAADVPDVRLRVWARPRAAVSAIVGLHDGALAVRLAAPPVDGAANEALVELFVQACGLPRRSVVIEKGHGGRHKIVRLIGAVSIPDEWVPARVERG